MEDAMEKHTEKRYTPEEMARDMRLFSFEVTALETCSRPQNFKVRARLLFKKARKFLAKMTGGKYLGEERRSQFILLISQINLLMLTDAAAGEKFADVRARLLKERFGYLASPEYERERAALAAADPAALTKAQRAFRLLGN